MLDENNKVIEQYMTCARGRIIVERDGEIHTDGAFGMISATPEIAEDRIFCNELDTICGIIEDCRQYDFPEKISRERKLKPGAKPNIFKKYKDSDYYYEEVVKRGEIQILAESFEGNPRSVNLPGTNTDILTGDFRYNPNEAPYRIGAVKLGDGRLVIARIGYIGHIYGKDESRGGNTFRHVLIFPEGTELKDIDLNKLSFKSGLEPKYFEGNIQEIPRYIDKLSINDMWQAKQKASARPQAQKQPTQPKMPVVPPRTQDKVIPNMPIAPPKKNNPITPAPLTPTQKQPMKVVEKVTPILMSDNELLELCQKEFTEKNPQVKRQLKQQIDQQIKFGANIQHVKHMALAKQLTHVKSTKKLDPTLDDFISHINEYEINSKFSELITRSQEYEEVFNHLYDGPTQQDKDNAKNRMVSIESSIHSLYRNVDAHSIHKYAMSEMRALELESQITAELSGKPYNPELVENSNYYRGVQKVYNDSRAIHMSQINNGKKPRTNNSNRTM